MSQQVPFLQQIKIFISHASDCIEDESLLKALEKQLINLKRLRLISYWHTGYLQAGQDSENEIKEQFETADIILLLVSPDFLASDTCYNTMEQAIEKHNAKNALVVPIILRPIEIENTPLSKLQLLPSNREPVTSFPDKDVAFLDISRKIGEKVRELFREQNIALALDLHRSNQPRNALDIIEYIIALGFPNAATYTAKGYILSGLQQFKAALTAYDRAIHISPEEKDAYYGMASVLETLGEYNDASSAYQKVIALSPTNVDAHWGLTRVLKALKQYGKAVDVSINIIRLTPKDTEAYRELANLLYRNDFEYDFSKSYLEIFNILVIKSLWDRFLGLFDVDSQRKKRELALAAGDNQSRRIELALAAYETIIRLAPKDVEAYWGKARVLEYKREPKLALAAYEMITSFTPDDVEAYRRKAYVLEFLREYMSALIAYNHITRLAPNDLEACWGKARALQSLGEYSLALEVYEKIISLVPNDLEALKGKARVLESLDFHKKALEVYEQVIGWTYEDVGTYMRKARILILLDSNDEALIAIEKAISLAPDNKITYLLKSLVLEELCRKEEANQAAKKYLEE